MIDLREYYKPAKEIQDDCNRDRTRKHESVLMVGLVAVVPLMFLGSLFCFGLASTHLLVRFYLFGGHAFVLLFLFLLYAFHEGEQKSASSLNSTILVGIVFLFTALASWFMPVLITFLDAAWFP